MPERIQRKRTKGWRMPENTVYVGRGSKWGNPYVLKKEGHNYIVRYKNLSVIWIGTSIDSARAEAVRMFRLWIRDNDCDIELIDEELRGKNLACWCPLDQPCHADVLLELLNETEEQ